MRFTEIGNVNPTHGLSNFKNELIDEHFSRPWLDSIDKSSDFN